jgi:putative PIN family toxin of toxin-antitoxin system
LIVVVDSNVWISALQFSRGGATIPFRALTIAKQKDLIVSCDEIEAEILRTLTGKFRWPRQYAIQAIESMMRNRLRVRPAGSVKICRDPADDLFLECAELALADLLITGDKDLLVLGTHKRTRIITPADYLRLER